ncbi:MAG TPA: AsmA family protein [Gammaproteobacteria bacterium]|nr:AsmA family protein [Gammaproteobacteria bacterium]
MKQFFTLGLKILLALILVMTAVLISLPFLVDPNDYKDTISEQVKAQTGRTLNIPGNIQLSVFPWLGARLGKVELENTVGFGKQPFASMDAVDVRIQLLPLLRGDIKIGHLTLRGLKLNLQRNKNGQDNWEDLLPKTGKTTVASSKTTPQNKSLPPAKSPAPASPRETPPPSTTALAALSVDGISILNASLQWDDQQTQQHYQIRKLDMEIGHISLNRPIPLETSFDFISRQPVASASIKLKTRLQLNWGRQVLKLAPFKGQISYRLAKSARMAAIRGTTTLSSQLTLDLKKQKYTFKQLTLRNRTSSTLLPGGKLDARIESKKIRVDMGKQSLRTDFLLVKAYGLELQARLNIHQFLNKPRYLASVDLKEFNPRRLMKILSMESLLPITTDKNVLTRARVGLRIIGNTNDLLLKPIILQLDDSNLQGYVSIHNFSQPVVRYKLVLNKIDLDRYLPAPAKTRVATAVKSRNKPAQHSTSARTSSPASSTIALATRGPTIKLPLDLLRRLNINGQLRIGKLKIARLRLNTLTLGTTAKAGQIRIKPISANVYQGSYNGDIQLDVRSTIPRVKLNGSLQNIAIGPLLKDLIGDDKIRGKASIRATLSSDLGQGGLNIMAVKQSLNGNLSFIVKNGALKGFNLARFERELRAKLKKQPLPDKKTPLETDFAQISGSAKIRNGILDNRDLHIALPHARARGQGKINLVRERLDYRLDIKFTSAAEGQSGQTWEQMNKVPLPIYIRGSFSQPEIKVDYQSVLKILAKQALKKQEQKLKQKARERLKQEEGKLKQKARERLKQDEDKIKQKAKEALKNLFKF